MSHNTYYAVYLLSFYSLKRLIQILNDIINMLGADRKTNRIFINTYFL